MDPKNIFFVLFKGTMFWSLNHYKLVGKYFLK